MTQAIRFVVTAVFCLWAWFAPAAQAQPAASPAAVAPLLATVASDSIDP